MNRAELTTVNGGMNKEVVPSGLPATVLQTEPSRDVLDAEFVALFSSTYPRLVRALELGGTNRSAAEDLAQEAFARTLGHWRRVRRGSNPAGYVYRIAFRLTWRRRRDDDALTDAPATPDFAGGIVTALGVESSLAAMPQARRRCAVLCLVVGLSTKEAAQALGIAESTVRKQIERAREDLRAAVR